MAVNQNIYPYNAQVKNLPIYLTGIGGSEYQYHIRRASGYHWHQILYSAKGKGELRYDNVTVGLSEGDCFFLPMSYPHEYYAVEGNWDVRWVAFDGYACPHILSQFGLFKPCIVREADAATLQSIYKKMFLAQKTDKVYGNYSCSGLIYEYVVEFYRLMLEKSRTGGNDRSNLLMPVLNYIEEHFASDFPMTVLAEQAGITPQHLCRIFKETMNMRPTEYLAKRRLEEAKKLLSNSDIPVADIGVRVGFPDPGYFSTVFRRYEGISPVGYRKNKKSM